MTKGGRVLPLQLKYILTLVLAVIASFGLGILTDVGGNAAIERIYLSDEAYNARCETILDNFEAYVKTNSLEVRQATEIARWAKRQNHVNLTIWDGENMLLDWGWWNEADFYTAFDEKTEDAQQDQLATEETAEEAEEAEEADGFESGTRMIRFSDGVYEVSVVDFSEIPLYTAVSISAFAVGIGVFLILMMTYHQLVIQHIIKLSHEVEAIAHGSLNGTITVKNRDEIGILAENVDTMRASIITQMRAEQEAWNANRDLITRMSHDIRTPLTVLLGFLELLDEGNYSQDATYQNYLGICKQNANQLKELADKLFQYFLAFGQKTYELKQEVVDARTLLGQLIGEYELLLVERGWKIRNEPLPDSAPIQVDPAFCKRLFDNLFSNIEKYADRGETVVIEQRLEPRQVHITLRNRIRPNPNPVESTNIGLKTCQRIAQLMGGSFRTEQGEKDFLAQLWLPIYTPPEQKTERIRNTGRFRRLDAAALEKEKTPD